MKCYSRMFIYCREGTTTRRATNHILICVPLEYNNDVADYSGSYEQLKQYNMAVFVPVYMCIKMHNALSCYFYI